MASKCPKADIWCTSGYETIKTSFQWVINDFNGYPYKTGQKIRSSTFGSDTKTKWCLEVYPNGVNEENKEFVALFLYLKESDKKEVLTKYSLATLDFNQRKQFEMFLNGKKPVLGFNNFISRSELENPENQLLRNDVLTIYCDIKYFGELKTISGQNIALKRSHEKLLEDMTALYQNPNYSDVEIVVKGHKFSAHKAILMTRSSVFAAMFKHSMNESQQNKVVIKDIEKQVFDKVLCYIYTDSVVNEDIDSNIQLFMAADKYNLDDLKSICEEYIVSQLTVESVSDVLIVADNHSAQELKAKAIDFIKKNTIQVMKTEGWAKVIIDRSDLLQLL